MKKFIRISVLTVLVAVLGLVLNVSSAKAATSPTLGTANSFTILSATNITNVPPSVITGDVGLSPATGAGIGLTTAQVNGVIYAVDNAGPAGSVSNPGLLTTAQVDNVAAFDALSAVPNVACNPVYAVGTGPVDLGGATLVPGVYCADAFELSGTLTLDDTGAADGVWIFRSELSTLITSAGSVAKVRFLTGVGSPCNVWWKVASSATLNTGTEFIGNILALTSISMKTGATLDGRALAQTGAVTLEQNTITNAMCIPSAAVKKHISIAVPTSTITSESTVTPIVTPALTVTPKLPNAGSAPIKKNMLWYYIAIPAGIISLVSIYVVKRKQTT